MTSERKRRENEERAAEDYLEELIEARMEQAEMRFKSSKHWVFKIPNVETTKK
jgi:hypothetical protein